MTTDPVCKMQVAVANDTLHTDVADKRYYFCSQHCQEKFRASPAAYIEPAVKITGHAAALYTCPMHPEIRQSAPGNCPKCGMALEEVTTATAANGIARPLQFGMGACLLLLAIYFAVVGLISGMDFAFEQFAKYWFFIVPLALGFGLQVGLFTHLKHIAGQHGATGKVVAVSGTTSTAAMVSCCAHYLTNILPILGVTGFLAVVAEYQVELFWLGLAFNAAGVMYILSKVINASREHKKC
ncbi:MAG: heavy metal-binding domain-containing protein [Gallionellaceae bacterium]